MRGLELGVVDAFDTEKDRSAFKGGAAGVIEDFIVGDSLPDLHRHGRQSPRRVGDRDVWDPIHRCLESFAK
jgi:hypothetical protein